jgi:aldose 1-epimerase
MIKLAKGGIEVEILPEIGGGVSRFAFNGRDVLRPTPANPAEANALCSFAMLPFANRIEKGQLRFRGREYRLGRNFGNHPHALHGHGWQTQWDIKYATADEASIVYDYSPGDWPWAYSAEQVFELTDTALEIRAMVRNCSREPMPVSLGFHPYFPKTEATRLISSVNGMWLTDETLIPTERVAATAIIDMGKGIAVAGAPFVDNTFTGWRAPAQIDQPDFGYSVVFEATIECPFFHVFIPVGKDYFAAEPVSSMPNCFNRPESSHETGARSLAPNETFAIGMRLEVRTH